MTVKRKLPCPACHQLLLVHMTQAGETVQCVCGQSVVVPTMRELRQLPTDEAEATTSRNASAAWSPLQGLMFVAGCLMIIGACYGHFRIRGERSQLAIAAPEFPEMPFDVQILSPTQAWEAWEYFQTETLETRLPPKYLAARKRYDALTNYLYGTWAAGGVGVLLLGLSFIRLPRSRPNPAKSR